MNSEDLYAVQREWAERTLMATRRLLPRMAPVSTYTGWQPHERETISFLLTAAARATESAFLLCAYGQLWDAEVLARSVVEASLKFAYLLQSRQEFAARHTEYADNLFDIALLKKHRKVETVLAAVPDPDAQQWLPIRDLLLPDSELAELSGRYDKAARRSLETRWGFTGLIGELSRSGDPYFGDLGALAHGYSMASHVHHADMVGVAIVLERDRRSDERREAVHLAHEARLLSDLLELLFLRLAVGYRFVAADKSQLAEVRAAMDEARAPFRKAAEDWFRIEYPGQGT
ncbi:DUF5677 domain-containing protein [Bradyrhizobium sp. USDA 3315]